MKTVAVHYLVTEEPTLTALSLHSLQTGGRECVGLGAYFSERAVESTGL
jgi:hypothetical protein